MISTQQIHLKDEEATLRFGLDLARATFLDPASAPEKIAEGIGEPTLGGVIHLHGDLGAGKTTLARGIMRGYGHRGAVKSPTYTIVEPYEFERCNIYHFDLYRLVDPEEMEYLGTDEYFSASNLCIVEWAEKGRSIVPAADLKIDIESDGTGRLLRCQSLSGKGEKISKRLWP
ncbi:MAG: tRNA (adenosine(37)-N6)-threonylcarbamoyltransferase complex ATPase subunit type 1 TsaE [SAR86 cluster bacterium]|uniref:tRNA threonylcarbamoyladenosine biosynthesis protein TsaE n=1 Tax=SAR86 cluster bacterium TaxID=2030880 RepID=A0A2A5AYL0_9GAMM|nr:MAG: tRNA (adenosine(37)-N6)-threonylcarbamoyltransferase complex ATPase subunit type 1 TsaE [SAR86 cluster bacterium]